MPRTWRESSTGVQGRSTSQRPRMRRSTTTLPRPEILVPVIASARSLRTPTGPISGLEPRRGEEERVAQGFPDSTRITRRPRSVNSPHAVRALPSSIAEYHPRNAIPGELASSWLVELELPDEPPQPPTAIATRTQEMTTRPLTVAILGGRRAYESSIS